MKELLEDYYGRNDEKFFRFVDTYASGKTDGGFEDFIMEVYKFSQSNPWPAEWIAACRAELDVDDQDPESMFRDTAWMQYLLADVRRQAEEFSEQLGEALELAQLEDGPQAYLPMLMEDKRVMDQLAKVDSYNMVHKILSAPLFGRLSAVRG